MSWIQLLPAILIAALYAFIPGIIVGLAAGLRRVNLFGLAPVFSMSVLFVAATPTGWGLYRWGMIPVAVATVVIAGVVLIVRLVLTRRWPTIFRSNGDSVGWGWISAAALLAFIPIALRTMFTIDNASNISQTYDNVFHLNGVRFILDSGRASSFTLMGFSINDLRTPSFYPGGWHELTSLVAQLNGSNVPTSVNAVAIVLAGLMWPAGVLFLMNNVFGTRRAFIVSGGVAAAALAGFPYMMLNFGVLYSFATGLSLILPIIALLVVAFNQCNGTLGRRFAILLVVLAVPGLFNSHPTAMMAVLAVAAVLVLLGTISTTKNLRRDGAPRSRFVLLYAISLVFFVLTAYAFIKLRLGTFWNPRETLPQALGEVLFAGPLGLSVAWVASALMITGIVLLIVRRINLWLILTWALFAMLFVVSAGTPLSKLRSALTGMWFGDPYRFAAMLAIVTTPLVAYGLFFVATRMPLWLKNWKSAAKRPAVVIGVTIVIAAFAFQFSNLNDETAYGKKVYAMNSDSPLLTPDERTLLQQVDQFVPEGTMVAGNPWTGTSLVYAYANRPTLIPHVGQNTPTTDIVSQHLQDAAKDPAVCETVRKYKIGYVLDFGIQEVHYERHEYEGFENLSKNPSVKFVTSVGTASLWKIVACGV